MSGTCNEPRWLDVERTKALDAEIRASGDPAKYLGCGLSFLAAAILVALGWAIAAI